MPSNNRNQFALISRQSPERFQGEVWEITVFNAAMELSWTNTVQLPYRSDEFDDIEFSLDSLGNLRALSRIFPGRQQRKSLQLNQRHPFMPSLVSSLRTPWAVFTIRDCSLSRRGYSNYASLPIVTSPFALQGSMLKTPATPPKDSLLLS